jgi:hypothetical protein
VVAGDTVTRGQGERRRGMMENARAILHSFPSHFLSRLSRMAVTATCMRARLETAGSTALQRPCVTGTASLTEVCLDTFRNRAIRTGSRGAR